MAGAVLRLTDAAGTPLPAICFASPAQQGQTTGADGAYRFDIAAGAAPQCPVGQTAYQLAITAPAGYLPGFANSLQPQSGALDATICPIDAVIGGSCQVQAQANAPATGNPTTYFTQFLIASGDRDIVNNHLPLDPVPVPGSNELSVAKIAASRIALRGAEMKYTLRLSNPAAAPVGPVRIVDRMPAGFSFVTGSATIAGIAAVPAVDGRNVTFQNVTVPAGSVVNIELSLRVPVNAAPGDYINEVRAFDPVTGTQVGNTGRATVTVQIEAVFDCGDLIGKVFDDLNRNGYQDEGEPGLAGVRLATVKGELITTDKNGRYNVPCAMIPDAAIGSNFILKLDTRTLPTGYIVTTDNPRTIRLTKGKVSKLNFGAAISRVVRLDLKDEAFAPGTTELLPQWEEGVRKLINVLAEEPSVLRMRYLNAGSDAALARRRSAGVVKDIQQQWRLQGNPYKLEIDSTVVR